MLLSALLQQMVMIADVDASPLADSATAQDVLDRETAVMKTFRILPLEWVPQVYGLSARVRDWKAPAPARLGRFPMYGWM